MNRRNFLRSLGAAVVVAATSSYGKLGAATKLELKPHIETSHGFAYREEAPSFVEWTRREGAGVNLPYGVVRPSEVVVQYKRAVETVLTFEDGPFKPSEVKKAWQAGDLDALYGGCAGGGKTNMIRRQFLEALGSTKGNRYITDKAKTSTFKGIRRAFLELFK